VSAVFINYVKLLLVDPMVHTVCISLLVCFTRFFKSFVSLEKLVDLFQLLLFSLGGCLQYLYTAAIRNLAVSEIHGHCS